MAEASHTDSADFSLSSQNPGFHNNPVKTYLQQAVYTVAANFCVALPDLSKLLTAPWLLETVAATLLVSLSHQGPVRIVLLVWNSV